MININRFDTDYKSFSIPYIQSDDLSFYQNAISKSQENSSEVREKSAMRGDESQKSGHYG